MSIESLTHVEEFFFETIPEYRQAIKAELAELGLSIHRPHYNETLGGIDSFVMTMNRVKGYAPIQGGRMKRRVMTNA